MALTSCADRSGTGAYPEAGREVRHVIPWRAGGSTDAAMRGFVGYLEKHLGTRIVTENVPGGLSSVGLTAVGSSSPDGYTLGTMTYDVLTVEYLGLATIAWRSFEPICTVTDHPSALMTLGDRWPDLDRFRETASESPGRVTVGNVGLQGIWHQHAVAMERAMGVSLRHVPYEGGSGPQLAALLGGEVDAIVSSLPAALPYLADGTLSVLAIMSAERNALVSSVPTFGESGYPLEFGGFRVLVAPRGTPDTVLQVLEAACRRAAADAEYRAWADRSAIGAAWRDRAETTAYLEELAPRVRALMADMEAG